MSILYVYKVKASHSYSIHYPWYLKLPDRQVKILACLPMSINVRRTGIEPLWWGMEVKLTVKSMLIFLSNGSRAIAVLQEDLQAEPRLLT
jgi:hypothetical protein